MLLKHSYIQVLEQGEEPIVRLHLHLCFVDPQDKHDQPQVVVLKTHDDDIPVDAYNLGDTVAHLWIKRDRYILLRGDSGFTATPSRGSYYHQETGELHLVFDDQPEPPPQAGA
jgi:hypothetical protein